MPSNDEATNSLRGNDNPKCYYVVAIELEK